MYKFLTHKIIHSCNSNQNAQNTIPKTEKKKLKIDWKVKNTINIADYFL